MHSVCVCVCVCVCVHDVVSSPYVYNIQEVYEEMKWKYYHKMAARVSHLTKFTVPSQSFGNQMYHR